MFESILQAIGRTPLVKLRRLAEGLAADDLRRRSKRMNPGGSIKDRVAVAMIADAEKRGWLRPGGTIIEATAGNTGVGLAMVAAVKGYRCIFVLPDKMIEREDQPAEGLRRRGRHHADRRRRPIRPRATTASPTGSPAKSPAPGGPTSSRTCPTPKSTTAPPARKSGSRPTAESPLFVGGVGTGGTLSGVGTLPEGTQPGREDHRGRPGRLGPLRRHAQAAGRSRASARTSCPRRSTASSSTTGSASATPRAFHIARELARRRKASSSAARAAPPSPPPCATPAG